MQAGCSSNFTKMPLLLFISLRVVPIDTVVALRQSFTSIWVASTSSCLLNNQRCAAVSLRLGTCWQRCQWQPTRLLAVTGRCHELSNTHYSPWQAGCLAAVPVDGKDPDISKILAADRGIFAGPCRGAPAATGAAQPLGELEENRSVSN